MNEWSSVFYYTLQGAAMLLSALGLWFSLIMPGVNRWNRRFFMVFFLLLIAYAGFAAAENAFRQGIGSLNAVRVQQFL